MKMPLEGIKVIDLTTSYSGPLCTLQLADYGAEVIKVEHYKKGDQSRTWYPVIKGCSSFFPAMNRNKKSVTLNLKSKKGKEILLDLVKTADVVVENFRAETLNKLGVSYEVMSGVNPRIIVASLCGFGQTGPYRNRSCYSHIAEALSGTMSMNGFPDGKPVGSGVAYGDGISGLMTAYGIMMALFHRERTGEGQYLDVAMVDSLIALNQGMIGEVHIQGKNLKRLGNKDGGMYPYDLFEAKDGYCILSVSDFNDWTNFAEACELEYLLDDPRFKTNTDRVDNDDELFEYINEWSKKHTRDEIEKIFEEHGASYAPVLTCTAMMENEQVLSRDMVLTVEDPVFEKVKMQGFPLKMNRTEGRIRKGAPLLGEDNAEVFGSLGYSEEDINKLKQDGVI
jgi:crotonobetainyl-CoA:carnitine CoA-transferase CaiB-like acyl-CoA transferase